MTPLDLIAFLLAAVLALLGSAKLMAVPRMRAAAAHVAFSTRSYRGIGALELAAAIGLVAGRSSLVLGVASAAGVLLLMIGAVLAHARAGDGLGHWLPAIGTAALAASYAGLLPGATA
jgi:hypothetical protein